MVLAPHPFENFVPVQILPTHAAQLRSVDFLTAVYHFYDKAIGFIYASIKHLIYRI